MTTITDTTYDITTFTHVVFFPTIWVTEPIQYEDCGVGEAMEDTLARAKELVDEQAEDEGLWFIAKYASEAYLQAALRKLHRVIEEIR